MKSVHAMPYGSELRVDGTCFRLWAPGSAQVRLVLAGEGEAAPRELPMQALADGWHELEVAGVGAGALYQFRLPDGLAVPDPASRFNPQDVHGPSQVVDPATYDWSDGAWRGRPWHEAVVYELHVGAFTPAGTYDAARARLPELAALGITAVELMPLADFPGRRGWGYDGVLPFAPDASYGTPEQLKRFVDEAHRLGLMVLLDVVYNHFGPEGNYLHALGPTFFTERHHTPWGAALNFDGEHSAPVRGFFVHNALYWVEEYHFDGLRLDAVHQILDDSPQHIVAEIAHALRAGPGRSRPVHLVLENEKNQASLLGREARGAPECATAQWNDDLHHAAHVLVTGEADGYYADYADAPVANFARALAQGFVFQGQPSPARKGAPHGEPSGGLPSTAMVSFLQNHDQIGNRAFGDRIDADATASTRRRLEAAYACLLLSPHVPMLFMGEEFAASTPFLFFCDFGPELAEAVSTGRRAEFARFAAFGDEAARQRIPDPNDARTFEASKLRWDEREQPPHRARLTLVRELLDLRRRVLVPRLAGLESGGHERCDADVLQVAWPLGDGSTWHLLANFGASVAECAALPPGETVYRAHIEAPTHEEPQGGRPPARPEGGPPPSRPDGGTPPSRPDGGTRPSRPDGGTPPSRPDGGPVRLSPGAVCVTLEGPRS